jgi:DNA-binding transcriptional regulator/RsmH inhibitor MraZ
LQRIVWRLGKRPLNASLGDEKGQGTLIKFFSRTEKLSCSGRGKIAVSQVPTTHAGFKKEVPMVENFTTIGIRGMERYGEYSRVENEENDEISKVLVELGL